MPITKQAKKKMRRDNKTQDRHRKIRAAMNKAIKEARRKPSLKNLTSAYKMIDLAAKRHIIHKNKAARLKSRLACRSSKSQKNKIRIIRD